MSVLRFSDGIQVAHPTSLENAHLTVTASVHQETARQRAIVRSLSALRTDHKAGCWRTGPGRPSQARFPIRPNSRNADSRFRRCPGRVSFRRANRRSSLNELQASAVMAGRHSDWSVSRT